MITKSQALITVLIIVALILALVGVVFGSDPKPLTVDLTRWQNSMPVGYNFDVEVDMGGGWVFTHSFEVPTPIQWIRPRMTVWLDVAHSATTTVRVNPKYLGGIMAFEELVRISEQVEIPIPAQRPANVKWVEMEIRYFDVDRSELPVDIFFVRPQAETELRVMFQPWGQAVRWEFRYRLHFQTPSAFSDPVVGELETAP